MDSNKRHQSVQPTGQSQVTDPDTASLATISMRIRKAVAEGYSVPTDFQYQRNYHQANYNSFDRIPLPNSLSQPPSLSNSNSTFDSSTSSLSCWNQPSPLQTISSPERKRKLDEPNLNDYIERYGELKFNEQF